MPKLFKLVKEHFSEEYQEQQWTYQCLFTLIFNHIEINQITITDHVWKKKGREMITKEFILELLTKISGETLESMEYKGKRKPYEWEVIHAEKPYIIFFWFDDYNPHGLWIRNCYRID